MGSSQKRTGAVPESSSEINEGIVRGVFEQVGGRNTPLGQAIQVAPGGKQLEKRFAGDINLPAFFGSKDETAGTGYLGSPGRGNHQPGEPADPD